jgi:5-methyltetrahydropteroyltriglutamate--homocysteine methyltransferase
MQLPPVATTTTGSFPRPGWLGEPGDRAFQFRLEGAGLKEAQDDATLVSLHEQEEVGLDLLTDGEQRRTSFINHIIAGFEGFDFAELETKVIRRFHERLVPRVVGQVRRRGSVVVDDLRFAKAHTAKPVKMTVPGPMTVVDSTFDTVYGDESLLAMDVAVALNAELLELQAAGCDVIQIDEPAMTRYHEKVSAYGALALDRCLEGVTVPTIVHLCYGYPGRGPQQHQYTYDALFPMLLDTRIGGFSVEFARSGYDSEVLRGCGDRLVMYGCVDPGDGLADSAEMVRERVRAALRYVDPARLWIAPDCGLQTISRELAQSKAQLLVQVANELRSVA